MKKSINLRYQVDELVRLGGMRMVVDVAVKQVVVP